MTNMDKLYEAVEARGPVCVGLDTDFSYLPEDFVDSTLTKGENIVRFNRKLIDATKAVAGFGRRYRATRGCTCRDFVEQHELQSHALHRPRLRWRDRRGGRRGRRLRLQCAELYRPHRRNLALEA